MEKELRVDMFGSNKGKKGFEAQQKIIYLSSPYKRAQKGAQCVQYWVHKIRM